jgi:hypothetical protein
MASKQIKHTRDYGMFERSSDNRPVDMRKHSGLIESMKQYGFLPEFPIVCVPGKNGKIIIRDGQHRFQAACSLGLYIYWIDASRDFDVAILSKGQRPWVPSDYAHKWADNGVQAYRDGLEFAEKYKLPIARAFSLLAGTTSFTNIADEFRNGTLKIKEPEFAATVAGLYAAFVKASPSVRNDRFVEACIAVCRVNGIDISRLIGGMARCREKLVAYSTREAYLEMLEDIYNFGRKVSVGLKAEAMNAMRIRSASAVATARKIAKSSEAQA